MTIGTDALPGQPPVERTAARAAESGQERITVVLTRRSVDALVRVSALTGDTKTDCFNRALQVYALIAEHLATGGEVYLKDANGDGVERVRFF